MKFRSKKDFHLLYSKVSSIGLLVTSHFCASQCIATSCHWDPLWHPWCHRLHRHIWQASITNITSFINVCFCLNIHLLVYVCILYRNCHISLWYLFHRNEFYTDLPHTTDDDILPSSPTRSVPEVSQAKINICKTKLEICIYCTYFSFFYSGKFNYRRNSWKVCVWKCWSKYVNNYHRTKEIPCPKCLHGPETVILCLAQNSLHWVRGRVRRWLWRTKARVFKASFYCIFTKCCQIGI